MSPNEKREKKKYCVEVFTATWLLFVPFALFPIPNSDKSMSSSSFAFAESFGATLLDLVEVSRAGEGGGAVVISTSDSCFLKAFVQISFSFFDCFSNFFEVTTMSCLISLESFTREGSDWIKTRADLKQFRANLNSSKPS
jgi:hypothetical protein